MRALKYNVDFMYDDEADVWVATSPDIIGLVLESETLDVLMERVKMAVPELLELNHQPKAKYLNFNTQSRLIAYA